MTIRILLADDHSVVRQGLKMFLALDDEGRGLADFCLDLGINGV